MRGKIRQPGQIPQKHAVHREADHLREKHAREDLEYVISENVDMKRSVVEGDEFDTGRRQLLNLGHTLGHAYELAYHYETYTHGQAVAAGMCRVAELGVKLGITAPEVPEGVLRGVRMYDLPERIPCDRSAYEAAIGLDKKGAGSAITVILLDKLGTTRPVKMDKTKLLDLIEECYEG